MPAINSGVHDWSELKIGQPISTPVTKIAWFDQRVLKVCAAGRKLLYESYPTPVKIVDADYKTPREALAFQSQLLNNQFQAMNGQFQAQQEGMFSSGSMLGAFGKVLGAGASVLPGGFLSGLTKR